MIICADDFNRAYENPLGRHWTTCPYWSNMKIENNQCKAGFTDKQCGAYWNANTFPNDQWAQIDIVTPPCGVFVRGSTTEQTLYHLYVESATTASLWRRKFGFTKLGSSFDITGITTLKLAVQGELLSVYGDGVLLGTRIDVQIASGTVGIFAYPVGILNNGILDNFMAGDFIANETIIPVLMAQYRQRWR